MPARLLVSLAGSTPTSVFVSRRSAPARSEAPLRPGPLISRWSHPRLAVAWTDTGSPRFPDDPSRAFAQLQDPGRTDAASPCRWRRCCPRAEEREGSSDYSYFGAYHWASAPAVYASRALLPGPGKTRFRLAGSPLPHGSRTRWIATKGFRSHDLPPFQGFPWRYFGELRMRAPEGGCRGTYDLASMDRA